MEDATDPEVWAMFERLNDYTLVLNRQEKLNARWFGWFKQAAYNLAADGPSLDAWEEMRIFNSRQIARMREVELTSDVLVAVVRGTSDISMIANVYRDYDDEFPESRSGGACIPKCPAIHSGSNGTGCVRDEVPANSLVL